MRKALAIAALLSLVAATAPSSQPAERPLIGWKGVVGLIPKKALPKGKTWDNIQQEDAKAALDEKFVGATVILKGRFPANIGGSRDDGYIIDFPVEHVGGIDCEARKIFLAPGTDLHGYKEGDRITVTARAKKYQLAGAVLGHSGPILIADFADGTIRKG